MILSSGVWIDGQNCMSPYGPWIVDKSQFDHAWSQLKFEQMRNTAKVDDLVGKGSFSALLRVRGPPPPPMPARFDTSKLGGVPHRSLDTV
jgi:hypothetical protein